MNSLTNSGISTVSDTTQGIPSTTVSGTGSTSSRETQPTVFDIERSISEAPNRTDPPERAYHLAMVSERYCQVKSPSDRLAG